MNQQSYIFGPVPSRRLNISLGVDLIPYKTCTLDCIYCESGKTTNHSVKRQSFVNPEKILNQLRNYLNKKTNIIDYVTFSGSGEPTLSKDLGLMIQEIKKMSNLPVCVLTNGTLLFDEQIRTELSQADLIIPSIDAVSSKIFQIVNRPHPSLRIDKIKQGLVEFSKQFKGEIWLEIFFVKNINDSNEEIESIYEFIKTVNFTKIQLNSIDRPPAYKQFQPMSIQDLENIKKLWSDFPVEIIKRANRKEDIVSFCQNLENSILNTIRRRPLTIKELENFTNKTTEELNRYLDILLKEKKVVKRIMEGQIFLIPGE